METIWRARESHFLLSPQKARRKEPTWISVRPFSAVANSIIRPFCMGKIVLYYVGNNINYSTLQKDGVSERLVVWLRSGTQRGGE